MNVKSFGVLPTGQQAHLYTIRCGGLEAAVTDFGAHLVSLMVVNHFRVVNLYCVPSGKVRNS